MKEDNMNWAYKMLFVLGSILVLLIVIFGASKA